MNTMEINMQKTKNQIYPDVMPLIQENTVTFQFSGEEQPCLSGDFNNWDFEHGVELHKASSDIWAVSMDFPRDTYMEYSYSVNGNRVLDPKNPRKINNGTGNINNYFYMPEARDSAFTTKKLRKGKLTEHLIVDDVRLVNAHRKIYLYQPATQEPCPLLVVYDGQDYLKRGRIISIIDNMISAAKIQPVALALVPSTKARFIEYATSDSTVSFINNQVIPLAQKNLNLIDIKQIPRSYCVLGASMGGMMALYTAFRFPQLFGKVICQSGAFRMFEEDYSIFEMVERQPIPPIKLWMDIGRYDFLYETNQRMRNLLIQKGCDVNYYEVNGGHNYTTWRNELPQALEYLFPLNKQ